MKLLLLSDVNSSHTQKWAIALAEKSITIRIFSLSKVKNDWFKNINRITVCSQEWSRINNNFSKNILSELLYLRALPRLKKVIKSYKPDIIHAHYATSYGALGAFSTFHPFIISVWGSDVFQFPKKSILHKKLLKHNLRKADKILSTSQVMADEVIKYTNKNVEVTPFGIDIDIFKPEKANSIFNDNDIVIGTIKSLEVQYGIEYLIRAFKILYDKYNTLSLKLMIVGSGSQRRYLELLADKLKISESIYFAGRVAYKEVNMYHNMISIFVNIPDHESFGVSVLEASACEKPIVVSNVGGLPEVVDDNKTGLIVPPKHPDKTADAIEKLMLDESLCLQMGRTGRIKVKEQYEWKKCVYQMLNVYAELLK